MPRHATWGWKAGFEYAATGPTYIESLSVGNDGSKAYTIAIPITAAMKSGNATDTGIDLPAHAIVLPTVRVRVDVAEVTGTTKTIDVGTLAGESGGDADGFADGAVTSAVGLVIPATSVLTTGLTKPYATDANTAKSIVVTVGSAATELEGVIYLDVIEVA